MENNKDSAGVVPVPGSVANLAGKSSRPQERAIAAESNARSREQRRPDMLEALEALAGICTNGFIPPEEGEMQYWSPSDAWDNACAEFKHSRALQIAQATIKKARAESREPVARTPQDYAIEHAGYLATAAENYLKVRNEYDEKAATDGCETADIDLLSDHHRALQSAIYEFGKRAKRLGEHVAQPPKEENNMHQAIKHVPPQYFKDRLSFDYSEKRNLYEISSGGYILAETEDSEVANAICKVFNELRESGAAQGEWIAVGTKLPPNNAKKGWSDRGEIYKCSDAVLAFNGAISTAEALTNPTGEVTWVCGDETLEKVTHWHPLPPPPEKEPQ